MGGIRSTFECLAPNLNALRRIKRGGIYLDVPGAVCRNLFHSVHIRCSPCSKPHIKHEESTANVRSIVLMNGKPMPTVNSNRRPRI